MLVQTLLMDTDEDKLTVTLVDPRGNLNLSQVKNGSATFLPFSQKIGGNNRKASNNNNTEGAQCLTPKHTKYVYRRVELGSLINKEIMQNEIDLDMELDRVVNESRDENPYRN